MVSLKELRGSHLRMLMTIVCGCAFSLFGYDQALYGGVASGEAFLRQFNHPSSSLTGQIAALFDIGCLVGAVSSTIITHRMGYKKTLFLGSAILAIGAIIQTASMNVGMLICGRIIGGVGNGINTSVTPVYHSETSVGLGRGRAVISELFVLDIGWLVAQFVTLGFSFLSSGLQWRFPTAIQILYLVPVFSLLPFLPESPRWLASAGRHEESETVLERILDEDQSSETLRKQLSEIREVVQLQQAAEKTKISELWTGHGRNLFRLFLACGVQLMGQIGGINIFAYYVVIIFESQLSLDSTLARVLAACAGFGWLLSNLASNLVIENWGRRKLLIIGGIGQASCFLVSGISLATGSGTKWSGILVVTMVYLFFIFFAFAWQSIPYLYPAEVLSLKYRGRFYGLSNACNWAINYVVVLVTPIGIANIGWIFFVLFAGFNIANVVIVWFFFVETAGKTLEEIDLMFIGDKAMDSPSMPPFVRLSERKKGSHWNSRASTVGSTGEKGSEHQDDSQHVETIHI